MIIKINHLLKIMDDLRARIEEAIVDVPRYKLKVREFPKQFEDRTIQKPHPMWPYHHYHHVAGSIIYGVNGSRELLQDFLKDRLDERAEETLELLLRGKELLDLYFQLLTEFPEYRQKEFDAGNGAFPDIRFATWEYPVESEKRLRPHPYANED